jgi:two-component system, NarL family, response regulator DevR
MVEDSPHWIEFVEDLLRPMREIAYLGCARTLAVAREACAAMRPHVLLLDLRLPDGDGFDLCLVRNERPAARTLLCTLRSDDLALHRFDQLHLEGLLWKETTNRSTLHDAIRVVASGQRYLPPMVAEARRKLHLDPRAFYKLLSETEQNLARLLGQGLTDQEVAERVNLSVCTVHNHRKNIMRKLDLHRSADLMVWAQRTGFVQPEVDPRIALGL